MTAPVTGALVIRACEDARWKTRSGIRRSVPTGAAPPERAPCRP
jgi:hypothetical protein